MAVWLLSGDLIVASQVARAAARHDFELQTYSSAEALLAATAEQVPTTVILDLSLPGLRLQELVAELKSLTASAQLVAFAPHVHAGKIAAAREAGCDTVISRGALHDRLDELLQDKT